MANHKAPLNGRVYPDSVEAMVTAVDGYYDRFLLPLARQWPTVEPEYVQRRTAKYADMFERFVSDRPAIADSEQFVGDMVGLWMYLVTPPELPSSAADSIAAFWAVIVSAFSVGKPAPVKARLEALQSHFAERCLVTQASIYKK